MVLLAHTLTGAVIGLKIKSPLIVIILCFVSHFILDRLPHTNLSIPKKIDPFQIIGTFPDVLPSICLYLVFLYVYPTHWINITLGVAFAILVDIMSLFRLLPRIDKYLKWLYNLHDKIQGRTSLLPGLFIQVVYITFLVVILYFVK
jgi:hypothetical protein